MSKYFYLLLITLACSVICVSCQDDNDEPVKDLGKMKSNDLEYFGSAFICPQEHTEDGKSLFLLGDVVDPAFPNILTIAVNCLEEATELFKDALPVYENAESRLHTDGDNIVFNATDQNDKNLCKIIFTIQSGNNPYAFVSFSEGVNLNGINRIEFIDYGSWPDNKISFNESKYCIGDVVNMNTAFNYTEYYAGYDVGVTSSEKHCEAEGKQPFICIKESTSQEAGILMCLTNSTYSPSASIINGCAPMNIAKAAAQIVSGDWELYKGLYGSIGRNIEDDPCIWTGEREDIWFTDKIYYINIKTRDVDWNDLFNKKVYRRGMIIKTFK